MIHRCDIIEISTTNEFSLLTNLLGVTVTIASWVLSGSEGIYSVIPVLSNLFDTAATEEIIPESEVRISKLLSNE